MARRYSFLNRDDTTLKTAGCSRFPEPGSLAGWQALFNKLQNATYIARGPLAFLPSWVPPVDDVPHEPLFLSSTGAREAFDLGVELRKRYRFTKGGDNFTVWSVPRVTVLVHDRNGC